ncbi:MAG: sensor histidine kinase [Acidimicrobiales bacterium]
MARAGHRSALKSPPLTAASAALARDTARRLTLLVLAYRSVGTAISATGIAVSGTLSAPKLSALLVVTTALLVGHALLARHWHVRGWPDVQARHVVVDVAIAIVLNLFASALMPEGSLFFDYRNPFSVYAVGTLALWTGLAGPTVGAGLMAMFVGPLQLAMAGVNGIPFGSINRAKFATRSLWLVTAFTTTWLLVTALRRGAEALAYRSEQAGRQAQRTAMLCDLHDGVLQTFAGVIRRCTIPARNASAAIKEIHDEVRTRAATVREILGRDHRQSGALIAELERLVTELDARAPFDVRLVDAGTPPALPPRITEALVAAVGEALRNAELHARPTRVSVAVERVGEEVRVVVHDDGAGFSPSEVAPQRRGVGGSIQGRLAAIGGSSHLATAPGQGTTWDLRAPFNRSEGDGLVSRALLSLIVVALAYRLLGLLISATGLVGSSSFGPITLNRLLTVMFAVALAHVGLILGTTRWGAPDVGPRLFLLDIGLAVALNVWAAAAVPDGTIFLDYRDPFTLYAQGTVALWAGMRGTRLGLGLLIAFALPMQLVMGIANGIPLASVDVAKLVSRGLWFIPAFGLGVLVRAVAQRGGVLLAQARLRAGVEAERAENLHALYAGVLDTLEGIERLCAGAGPEPASTLRAIAGEARHREAQLRSHLIDGGASTTALSSRLALIVADAERRGVAGAELVQLGPDAPLHIDAIEVVVGIVESVVGRSARHIRPAAEPRLNLLTESVAGSLRLVLRTADRALVDDQPYAAYEAELARVGGRLNVTTTAESGVAIEILVPSAREVAATGESSPVANHVDQESSRL